MKEQFLKAILGSIAGIFVTVFIFMSSHLLLANASPDNSDVFSCDRDFEAARIELDNAKNLAEQFYIVGLISSETPKEQVLNPTRFPLIKNGVGVGKWLGKDIRWIAMYDNSKETQNISDAVKIFLGVGCRKGIN